MRTSLDARSRHDAFIADRRTTIPPGPRLMDLPTADWILDNVLVHERSFPRVWCSCLTGICGRCSRGEHDQCSNTTRPGAWYGTCETWILDHAGTVGPSLQLQVWLADRTCRYRCPCRVCWAADRAPRPAVQLDLFAAEVA